MERPTTNINPNFFLLVFRRRKYYLVQAARVGSVWWQYKEWFFGCCSFYDDSVLVKKTLSVILPSPPSRWLVRYSITRGATKKFMSRTLPFSLCGTDWTRPKSSFDVIVGPGSFLAPSIADDGSTLLIPSFEDGPPLVVTPLVVLGDGADGCITVESLLEHIPMFCSWIPPGTVLQRGQRIGYSLRCLLWWCFFFVLCRDDVVD